MRTAQQLRADALTIWQAGVDAVDSSALVRRNLEVRGDVLRIADEELDLRTIRRIVVVGAGKAGAGMAAGVEQALQAVASEKKLTGWVNTPADCVRELSHIHLHAARPAGVNEPTDAGVAGAREILKLVHSLTADDLCLCLISGGGSALLPAPANGVTLADKQEITRYLSGAGANIGELNTVRKQLSSIKGGGLARAAGGGRLATLIISDVLGDPLDTIASGPTVADTHTPADALAVLQKFSALETPCGQRLASFLKGKQPAGPIAITTRNIVIGNNAVAVDAAGVKAESLGYSHAMTASTKLEGLAGGIGEHLADMAVRMRDGEGPDCLITGGEPTVELAPPDLRGKGGRNQQLVLAALCRRMSQCGGDLHSKEMEQALADMVILSGGTDGEDGPTDAAGAIADALLAEQFRQHADLDPLDYLRRNDAYHFFQPLGGLIKTGPTHTNVCDLRVVVVNRTNESSRK